MGYRVINFRSGDSDTREFKEAAMMAKEGIDRMCDLADEMRDRYSERSGYGMRGGYGRRDHGDWDEDEMYGERRRRDSRGRYM